MIIRRIAVPWVCILLIAGCSGESADLALGGESGRAPGELPGGTNGIDVGDLPADPFDEPCVEPLVHDPIAGYCVPARGEGLSPQEGPFRTRHRWLQEAQSAQEVIRYVVPGLPPGGTGAPESPLGSWAGATDNLPAGADVTFLVGRGRVDGTLELSGLGRVSVIGNAAAVTALRADNGPVLAAEEVGALRLWGLAIERVGDDPGPALELATTEAFLAGQIRLVSSSGDGIEFRGGGDGGLQISHSHFLAIAGDGLRGVEALGGWTIDETVFQGPFGGDGISLVDFGGSQFRFSNSELNNIGGDGISFVDFGGSQFLVDNGTLNSVSGDGISLVDFGGSQFRVMNSQFEGPIGGDGISLVDFGGSQFRSHQNRFASIDGSGISSRGGSGTFTIEESQMDGPIGRDGITIVGFSGARAHIGSIEMRTIGRVGISVRDALGWWTVDGANFHGPIGFDGLQFIGVGETGKRVKLTNLGGDGVGRVGMRLLDGLGWWTVDGANFRNTGQMAVQISGFSPEAAFDLHRLSVEGASGIGVMIDSTAASIELSDSDIDETATRPQGGAQAPGPALGYGLLAKDVGQLAVRRSQFRGNGGTAIVVDCRGWGARRRRGDLQGSVRLELDDLVVEDSEGTPVGGSAMRTQNMPAGTEVWVDGTLRREQYEDAAQEEMPELEMGLPGCGDGVVDEMIEECDDGNDSDNDACTANCFLNVCGDGLHHVGFEECDDGNEVHHGDGCNNDCEAGDRVVIPGGSFVYGTISNAFNGLPETQVDGFFMNRHEVTCEEFGAYWSASGSTRVVLSDGNNGAGDHSWYLDPHEGVVPTGWPFATFDAASPPEDAASMLSTPAQEAVFPQNNVVAGEGERWEKYYLFRRFRHNRRISGGFIDVHHPGAAIRVYLAGQLIHQAGWPEAGDNSPLVPESTNGMSRILLKDEAIEHHNDHWGAWKYIAIELRPFPPGDGHDQLAFALTYKVWNQTFQTPRKPWFNQRGEHISTGHGQLLCGDPRWPVAMDWHKARDYCRWHGGDLPTEAQWEYAARNLGQNIKYPWGNLPRITASYSGGQVACEYAHTSADTAPQNCPDSGIKLEVCSRPLGNTEQGLCDMIGNMWEWTLDGYSEGHRDGIDNDRDGHVDERNELLVPSASGLPLTSRPSFWSGSSLYVARGSSSANTIGSYTTGRLGRTATWFQGQASVDFGFRCAWPIE